jgi:hypothetical protein
LALSFIDFHMDSSRHIAKQVINLPKSGIRDFFDSVISETSGRR